MVFCTAENKNLDTKNRTQLCGVVRVLKGSGICGQGAYERQSLEKWLTLMKRLQTLPEQNTLGESPRVTGLGMGGLLWTREAHFVGLSTPVH